MPSVEPDHFGVLDLQCRLLPGHQQLSFHLLLQPTPQLLPVSRPPGLLHHLPTGLLRLLRPLRRQHHPHQLPSLQPQHPNLHPMLRQLLAGQQPLRPQMVPHLYFPQHVQLMFLALQTLRWHVLPLHFELYQLQQCWIVRPVRSGVQA